MEAWLEGKGESRGSDEVDEEGHVAKTATAIALSAMWKEGFVFRR